MRRTAPPATPGVRGDHGFKRWPFGWDAHATHTCGGLFARAPDVRKRENKGDLQGADPAGVWLGAGDKERIHADRVEASSPSDVVLGLS